MIPTSETDASASTDSETTATSGSPTPLISLIGLFLVLVAAWLLWSGLYKPLLLTLGAISCALCVYLATRMNFFETTSILPLLPRLPLYWLWLLKEIALSSLEVARVVLSPRLELSPTIVDLDAEAQTELCHVILGNSITLTPGTITLDIYKGRLVVHALTAEGAAALKEGKMNRRVAALEAR